MVWGCISALVKGYLHLCDFGAASAAFKTTSFPETSMHITELDWPACSPDLSPIENINFETQNATTETPYWDKMTPEMLHHLVS